MHKYKYLSICLYISGDRVQLNNINTRNDFLKFYLHSQNYLASGKSETLSRK